MDQGTAFRLLKAERPVSLIIDGKRFGKVMVTGLNAPHSINLFLETPIGEPDRRIRVPLDKVEVAP